MAVARAAQRSCNLPGFPLQARLGHATLAELIELLPERALIVVVEDMHGAHGVVAVSAALLTSVIEMQSMGRVSPHPPRDRRPTRTDASICADFINSALAELSTELGHLGSDLAVAAFRFASFVEDPKPLELMMEDVLYRSYQLEVRVGQAGQREGSFTAFLPGDAPAKAVAQSPEGRSDPAPAAPDSRDLAGAVRAAPISLNAILCRRQISLKELRALAPGTLISLPHDAMQLTRLEAHGGQLVARGKLGVLHGNHAIRIAATGARTDHSAALTDGPGDAFGLTDLSADDGFDTPRDGEDNVFAATETVSVDLHPDTAFEPPLEDAGTPDPFRDDGDSAAGEDDENPPMALPMNFVID